MAISKKIRFEVFKRDGFICQYCGKHPPETTLEVDHIIPVSKKGTDVINNLITSCFDCNRGKSNIDLKKIPTSLIEKKLILEEKEKQYIEYHKLLAKIDKRINKEIDQINDIYNSYFKDYELSKSFRISIKKFIEKLNIFEVSEAMIKACSIVQDENECLKYFCGICWSKIKGNG